VIGFKNTKKPIIKVDFKLMMEIYIGEEEAVGNFEQNRAYNPYNVSL